MLIGEKIVISSMTKEALPITLEWVNDPKYRYWNGTIFPISEFEHFDFFREKAKSAYDKIFLMREKKTMREIGFIGIKDTDMVNRNCEIFGSIGRKSSDYMNGTTSTDMGRGYGTEAFSLLSRFCLYELNLHKVYSRVYAYNERSRRMFQKAGFQEEARLKEHHYVNGIYEDVIVMSKSK